MLKQISLFLSIALTALIIYNCGDDDIVQVNTDYQISGSIVNWNLGTKYLKAMTYDSLGMNDFMADSTVINTNGSFTLKLKAAPDNLPYGYYIPDTLCTGNVVNPPGLKMCYLVIQVYNDSNMNIGGISRKNFDSIVTQGSYFAEYLFANTSGAITGSNRCVYGSDTTVSNYNLNVSKGWNKGVVLFESFSAGYIQISYSNNEPQGGGWYFTPIPSDNREQLLKKPK